MRNLPSALRLLCTMLFRCIYRSPLAHARWLTNTLKFLGAAGLEPWVAGVEEEGDLELIMKSAAVAERHCVYCLKLPDRSNMCSRCGEVRYCNKECQKIDWPLHSKHCGKITIKQMAEEFRAKQLPPHLAPPKPYELLAFVRLNLSEFLDPEWQPLELGDASIVLDP